MVDSTMKFLHRFRITSKCAFIFKNFHSDINDVIILRNTQKTAECLFTVQSHFTTHNTSHYSILKKKLFKKGIFAETYYLFASEQLLVYLLPILSQIFDFGNISIIGKS